MDQTFMKERPIVPLVISMAIPMTISMLVNSLYNIIDSYYVARISEQAMTALSLVYPVQNLINAIAIGFSIGIAALISLHLGAGNKEKADMAATHGMVLSLIHGVVISIVCTAIMPRFLRSFTSDETVIAMGVTYSRVAFMFAVVIMAAMAFEKIFQAVGRMKVTMAALIFGCVCNILLDPILIFGLLGFPRLEVAGAALATEPLVCAVLLAIFLIEVAVTRIVSLGSIIIAALYPVGTLINLIARGANAATIVFSTICCAIMAAMVIWLHRSNIERLRNGTEYRFGQKK